MLFSLINLIQSVYLLHSSSERNYIKNSLVYLQVSKKHSFKKV